MKLKRLLQEGPVRQLKNATLAAKFHADSAELNIRNAIKSLEVLINNPKNNPTAAEDAYISLKDARKELRQLQNFFKKRDI